MSPALEVWTLNHWACKEVPNATFKVTKFLSTQSNPEKVGSFSYSQELFFFFLTNGI